MKHLVYRKKNLLEWVDSTKQKITEPNSAIVEPIAIARCDLDLPIIRGETLFRPPFAIGHEFVAKVKEISEDQSQFFPIGSIVVVTFQISCGRCPSCSNLFSNSCESVPYTSGYGMPPGAAQFLGAVADEVKVPFASQMMIPLPEMLNPVDVASLSDNIAEVWKLVGQFLEKRKNPKVLIVGGMAKSISMYTALFLHQTKKADVHFIDSDRTRVDFIHSLGIFADYFETFPKPNLKYDIVVDCSATKDGWNFATRSLGKNGILSAASIFWTNLLEIPYLEMYNQGVEIHISRVQSKESMIALLPYLKSGVFTPGKIVSKVAKLEDAKDAWVEESTKLVLVR